MEFTSGISMIWGRRSVITVAAGTEAEALLACRGSTGTASTVQAIAATARNMPCLAKNSIVEV